MKKIVMIIMAVALVVLPTMAQDWQSTSSMTGSGSAYGAQVTAVGAVEVTDMATTTESYSPAKSGVRKAPPGTGGESTYDPNNPQFSPLGDAVWPLLLFAAMYCALRIVYRRKKALNR